MIQRIRSIKLLIVVPLLWMGIADASTVEVTATGTVTQVLVPDVYGTLVGDQITLLATFDTSTLRAIPSFQGIVVPGVEFASLAGQGGSLSIDMRGQHWSEQDDPLFGLGFLKVPLPHLVLEDGRFVGLDFLGIGPNHNTFLNDSIGQLYFGDPLGQLFGGDDNPNAPPFWIGQWDLAHASVVAVPEPDVYGLMLAGLLVTGAVARRRR